MEPSTPQYIIAIGTTVVGVKALESFFELATSDGASYIILHHFSNNYKKRLAGIIGKNDKLEIYEAEEGMVVEENKVYIIPPNKYMTIRQGTLHLTNKLRTVAPHFTIDTFFKSLATERGNKAIGIILTGIGMDGTLGVKAIHKAGGIILVQDPLTAKYKDMPYSAISTGLVNRVLAVSAMPKAIETYLSDTAYRVKSGISEEVQEDLNRQPKKAFPYKSNLTEDIHEAVMHASGYAGVCLDKSLTIMHTFGDLSPYLLPKVLNFNITQLLCQSILVVFHAAVYRSIKYNERVVLKRIQIKEESALLINVLIEPFVIRKTAQKWIIVLFSEDRKV